MDGIVRRRGINPRGTKGGPKRRERYFSDEQTVQSPLLGVVEAPETPLNRPESGQEPVPTGSIPFLLEWVGGDRIKAEAVLEYELARGSDQRKTLVAELKKILEDPDE